MQVRPIRDTWYMISNGEKRVKRESVKQGSARGKNFKEKLEITHQRLKMTIQQSEKTETTQITNTGRNKKVQEIRN